MPLFLYFEAIMYILCHGMLEASNLIFFFGLEVATKRLPSDETLDFELAKSVETVED